MVVVPDGHGFDAHGQHQTGSRSQQRGVVPPLRSLYQVTGGRPDAAPPRSRGGQRGGGRPDQAGQDRNGGQAAKDTAPAQRSATYTVRGLSFRILSVASGHVHSRSSAGAVRGLRHYAPPGPTVGDVTRELADR